MKTIIFLLFIVIFVYSQTDHACSGSGLYVNEVTIGTSCFRMIVGTGDYSTAKVTCENPGTSFQSATDYSVTSYIGSILNNDEEIEIYNNFFTSNIGEAWVGLLGDGSGNADVWDDPYSSDFIATGQPNLYPDVIAENGENNWVILRDSNNKVGWIDVVPTYNPDFYLCRYDIHNCSDVFASDPLVCNSRGWCGTNGNCYGCQDSYTGTNCEIEPDRCYGKLPGTVGVCGGHGTCEGLDTCLCATPEYYHWVDGCDRWDCGIYNKDDSLVCNGGEGICESPDNCNCDASDYYGTDCLDFACFTIDNDDPRVCHWGNGTCSDHNICDCITVGYSHPTSGDKDCSLVFCDSEPRRPFGDPCNSHGDCVAPEVCKCDPTYFGADCMDYGCGIYQWNDPLVCSGHGDCDGSEICTCDNVVDYTGQYCEEWYCFGTLTGDSGVCTGGGDCLDKDDCQCYNGYEHPTAGNKDCSVFTCDGYPSSDQTGCLNHGNCIGLNTCECNEVNYQESSRCGWRCYGTLHDDNIVCGASGVCQAHDDCLCGNTVENGCLEKYVSDGCVFGLECQEVINDATLMNGFLSVDYVVPLSVLSVHSSLLSSDNDEYVFPCNEVVLIGSSFGTGPKCYFTEANLIIEFGEGSDIVIGDTITFTLLTDDGNIGRLVVKGKVSGLVGIIFGVAGGLVGIVAIIAVVCLLVFFILARKKQMKKKISVLKGIQLGETELKEKDGFLNLTEPKPVIGVEKKVQLVEQSKLNENLVQKEEAKKKKEEEKQRKAEEKQRKKEEKQRKKEEKKRLKEEKKREKLKQKMEKLGQKGELLEQKTKDLDVQKDQEVESGKPQSVVSGKPKFSVKLMPDAADLQKVKQARKDKRALRKAPKPRSKAAPVPRKKSGSVAPIKPRSKAAPGAPRKKANSLAPIRPKSKAPGSKKLSNVDKKKKLQKLEDEIKKKMKRLDELDKEE